MPRRRQAHARALALLGLCAAALLCPAPASAAASGGWVLQESAARGVDPGLAGGCRRTLAAGRAVAFCDGGARARAAIAVRGSVGRPLVPGRKLRLRSKRASRRVQLALIYRSGDTTTYVRFAGFSRGRGLSAVVTSRRSGDRVVARMHVGGRTLKPVRRAVTGPAETGTPAPTTTTTPATPPPSTIHPGVDAEPGRTCGALRSGGDASFNALFATCGAGWTGGDTTYSVPLPDGRVAWLFSDSFLGTLADDGTRVSPRFVNNAIVIQDGARLHTVHGGDGAESGSVFTPADRGSWYWLGDGTVEGDRLLVLLERHHWAGSGMWDFRFDGSALATVSLSDMRVQSIVPLPNAAVAWGMAVLETADWTYVYGVEDHGDAKYAHLARARSGQLGGAWEYWAGSGWSADPASSARVASGVSNQFSVIADGGGYALVTQQPGFGRDIELLRAPAPEGPWDTPRRIATIPDPGPGRFTYNSVLHPEAGGNGGLLLSYNVGTGDSAATWRDGSIYRPGFLRVTLPPAS